LAFGFPNQRAYKIFERLGIYQPAGQVFELSATLPHKASANFFFKTEKLNQLTARNEREINQLWIKMAHALPNLIVPVKNADFFQYRYFSHPVVTYEVFVLRQRLTQHVKGVFVLKKLDAHQVELMDFIATPDTLELVMRGMFHEAMRAGFTRVSLWASDPVKDLLASFFETNTKLDVIIPTNAHTPSPPIEEIKQKWWLVGGDTDFK
jgi:hypothetical protein